MAQVSHALKQDLGKRDRLQRVFRKTTMCTFNLSGLCRNGKSCNFAHRAEELRGRPDLTKTTMCNSWLRGRCRAGSSCRFAHGDAELRGGEAPPQVDLQEEEEEEEQGTANKAQSNAADEAPPPSGVATALRAPQASRQAPHQFDARRVMELLLLSAGGEKGMQGAPPSNDHASSTAKRAAAESVLPMLQHWYQRALDGQNAWQEKRDWQDLIRIVLEAAAPDHYED